MALPESDFDTRFTVIPFNGEEARDRENVRNFMDAGLPNTRVFTMVEGGDQPDDMSDEDYEDGVFFPGRYGYLLPGYHYVNAVQYYITEQAWTDENEEWVLGD